jgi:hypothetical protein
VEVLIFASYVAWSRVSGLTRFRDGTYHGTASSFVQITKSASEALVMIRQAFGEESLSRK